jgi:DNA end-binding protein Ku
MAAIWKGTISFGLVSIPVAVQNAVKKDELKLRMVRKSDLSPINYKRVAEADGKEVQWPEVVKAYEYEKDRFIPLEQSELDRARAEGVQTIHILDFVDAKEIDPLFFHKPYILSPERGGPKAYALLREAMAQTGTVGIGKVVIRSKQHLASIRPQGKLLILELMNFAHELVDPSLFKAADEPAGHGKELDLAKALIGAMTSAWQPEKYKDDYKAALMEIIEAKIKKAPANGTRNAPQSPPTNVLNMVEMLERSLMQGAKPTRKPKHRKLKKAA